MSARDNDYRIMSDAARRGITLTMAQANTLRRAELTLHRWGEMECGDQYGNAIERDETTDKPYMTSEYGARWSLTNSYRTRHAIPDREKGALRRIAALCTEIGAHYYHQTDPRGCALYISAEPLTDSAYINGLAITTL